MPHSGPAPSGTNPVESEVRMYGYLLLTFKPEDVGISMEGIDGAEDGLRVFQPRVEASKLATHFRGANNVSHDGHVMRLPNGALRGRLRAIIDPFTDHFDAEDHCADLPVTQVALVCWVSSQRDVDDPHRLLIGTWRDTERQLAALTENSPSANDKGRIAITIYGPSVAVVREVFFQVVTGKIKPLEPWAV